MTFTTDDRMVPGHPWFPEEEGKPRRYGRAIRALRNLTAQNPQPTGGDALVLLDDLDLPFHRVPLPTRGPTTEPISLEYARNMPSYRVSYQFVRAMERMRLDLQPTDRQFVRCLKGNNDRPRRPLYVDVPTILPQLVAAGMLQAVTLQQTIYPNRRVCEDFRRDYRRWFPHRPGDDALPAVTWCQRQWRALTAFELAVHLPRAGPRAAPPGARRSDRRTERTTARRGTIRCRRSTAVSPPSWSGARTVRTAGTRCT